MANVAFVWVFKRTRTKTIAKIVEKSKSVEKANKCAHTETQTIGAIWNLWNTKEYLSMLMCREQERCEEWVFSLKFQMPWRRTVRFCTSNTHTHKTNFIWIRFVQFFFWIYQPQLGDANGIQTKPTKQQNAILVCYVDVCIRTVCVYICEMYCAYFPHT